MPLIKQQVNWELKLSTKFSEDQVHEYLYQQGLEALIEDIPELDVNPEALAPKEEDLDVELWCILKARAVEKIAALHHTIRYGRFLGSKVKLPTDKLTGPAGFHSPGERLHSAFMIRSDSHSS